MVESDDTIELVEYVTDDGYCRIIARPDVRDWFEVVEQVWYMSRYDGNGWKDTQVLGTVPEGMVYPDEIVTEP